MSKKKDAQALGLAMLLDDPFWDEPSVAWHDDDGVIHIRNSERGTLDKCGQQWWWSWRDGLRAKETATPLWFGTAIHEALAHYYGPGKKRRKGDFIDKFRESADMEAEFIRTEVGGLDEDVYVDARLLGETMLSNYVKEYNGDKDWDVIGTEQSFGVAIPLFTDDYQEKLFRGILRLGVGYKKAWRLDHFILNGTFDGVYRDRSSKRVKLMEHKTAKSISVRHLPMDNQAGTYSTVAQTVGRDQGWLGPKENIEEIMYNFLRKAMPDERPKDAHGYSLNKPGKQAFIQTLEAAGHEFPTNTRGTVQYPTIPLLEEMAEERGLVVLGERSKSQPPPLFERHPVRRTPQMRRQQVYRLQAEVKRMFLMAAGVMPVTKAPNRDTCVMCPFSLMCELHESGAGWTELRDSMFRTEDLYAVHRKSA